MIPILLALAAAQTAPPAIASDADAEARFRNCAAQVRANPEQGVETANAWRVEGGGLLARQCLGLAYVALERWAPAATVYDEAARDANAAQDPRRADLWVQAGNAWLAAGEATRAILALDAALATPNLTNELRGEVHLDRARALVSLGNQAAARQEIDWALQLVPSDPFAWYLSAALARRESNLARAQIDVRRAMQLAPDDPETTLLAGTLAGLAGNMEEAERLYRRVAESAPESEAGQRARASLATLREIEADAPATGAPAAPAAPAAAASEPQSR